MDIDRLILLDLLKLLIISFGSLMDIDRLIPLSRIPLARPCFGSLMDIDRLILPLAENKLH